jgi:hypothetical protein
MTKPTFENRTNFKEYIRYFKNKFNSPLQKVPYFYIEDMLTYEEPGISTTTDVNVVIFDFDDTVNIEEPIENNELIYIPALPGDQINLSVDNSLYTFNFIDEDGGIQYDEVTYGLGDSIPIGDKNLTVKGLGGALLQPTNAPSYSVGISTTFFNEGQEVIFIITTENVADGTQLYYTISGDVSANDFTDNTLSGSFNIVGTGETTGIATITKTSLLDLVEEGDEEFVFQVRTGSTSGPIVATSSTITIFDVSPIFSITESTTTINEGESITFTTTAENVASGTELFYTISGDVSANDFVQNTLSGSFSVIDFGNGIPVGSVTKNISLDLVEEGDEEFVFQVRTGSTSGTIVATSSTITIQDTIPTFIIAPTATSINEGQSVTFNVTTTDIPNQTEIFFTTIGTVTASDFSDNSLSGSFTILDFGGSNGVGAFTRNTVFDFISEQNKNFQIQLRLNSISGPIVGTSTTITVNNISPSFAITPSSNIINEGQSVTFTISTNVPNGTVLYYTTLGDVSASDFSDNALSGSVTISNQTATIVKTTLRDRKTEGDEQFAIQLRLDSVTGNIITTSSFVVIKDTSQNIGENANGLTFGPVQVNRDNGNSQLATDWYKICNIDELPPGSKIALFIDTSGSMTQSTIQASYDLFVSKLAEKNISIITVTNPNEDWITPFLTELD